MEDVVPGILESILIRLDVKDLIGCKSVCKLWHSFISSNHFVNAHLKHSYDNDRSNSEFRHRRIVMLQISLYSSAPSYGFYLNNLHHADSRCNIVGSSNGLVCIASSCGRILVANPSTRQFRVLPKPLPGYISGGGHPGPIGFGYDSFSDDYKVVLGSRADCCTRLSVLSLKTNAWKYVEQPFRAYQLYSNKFAGAWCNGGIHWVMKAHYSKYVIIAFDLSTEEFHEIPQPDQGCTSFSWLGIIDGCLCICHPVTHFGGPIWVMKSYNVKSSWTLLPPYDHVPHKVNDAIHTLKSLEGGYIPPTSFFTDDNEQIELRYKEQDLCAPIFVHSLVSPHVYRRLKRKRKPTNNHKLIEGCPS